MALSRQKELIYEGHDDIKKPIESLKTFQPNREKRQREDDGTPGKALAKGGTVHM